jgi:hypothetical protein
MSYREENGLVILSMSREDYDRLLSMFAGASALALKDGLPIGRTLELLNRLNEGNPNYTPYQVK